MAHVVRSYREIDGATRPEIVNDEYDDYPVTATGTNMIARVVWIISDLLLLLLMLRFVFALLGANPANPFANFIYTLSYPFVAPFFGLFSYNDIHYGVSRFEIFTLVAMAVYTLIAYIIIRVLSFNRRTPVGY